MRLYYTNNHHSRQVGNTRDDSLALKCARAVLPDLLFVNYLTLFFFFAWRHTIMHTMRIDHASRCRSSHRPPAANCPQIEWQVPHRQWADISESFSNPLINSYVTSAGPDSFEFAVLTGVALRRILWQCEGKSATRVPDPPPAPPQRISAAQRCPSPYPTNPSPFSPASSPPASPRSWSSRAVEQALLCCSNRRHPFRSQRRC